MGIRMSLEGRLRLLLAGVVSTVVVVTSGLFVYSLQTNLQNAMHTQNDIMTDALRRKGLAIARNVALTSGRAMAVRNFSFLVEVIDTAVKQDEEIVYGMVMDNDRRALVHSLPDQANNVLTGDADLWAASQTEATTQKIRFKGQDTLEVIAPVFAADQRWGTVRFGLSKGNLEREIALSERTARQQIWQAIALSLMAAIVFTLLGSMYGSRASARIVEPVQHLMAGAQRIRAGDFATPVVVHGSHEFLELAGTFNDMSLAVKQRENALEGALHAAKEANRLKSEFLANVSHELRTPLNAILNVPRALLKDYRAHLLWHCNNCSKNYEVDADTQADQAEAKEPCPNCATPLLLQTRAFFKGDPTRHYHYMQRILQSASHLLTVVTDVLDFSKLDAGKMVVNIGSLDIDHVLRDVIDIVTPLAVEREIHLQFPKPLPTLTMQADPVKMSQILINLLSNAIKFTDVGGWVKLTFREHKEPAEQIEITVEDNGMGIPSDKLEVIFESFRQVDGGHTRAHGGTGLGLTITRKLVELHGGKVWAESELGKGSRFSVLLPKHGPPGAGEHQTRPGSQTQQGRILLVDDDRANLELLEDVLVAAGFDVSSVSDANVVLATLTENQADAVILDIMMPDVTGLSILRALKTNPATKKIPIIVSSAYHSNRAAVQSLGGVWLPKPWSSVDLLNCLQAETQRSVEQG